MAAVGLDGGEGEDLLTSASIALSQACAIEAVVAFVGLVGVLQVCCIHNFAPDTPALLAGQWQRCSGSQGHGERRPRG